jgi:hypothetical protein
MTIKRAYDTGRIEKKSRGVYVVAGIDSPAEKGVSLVSSLVSETELTNSTNSHTFDHVAAL